MHAADHKGEGGHQGRKQSPFGIGQISFISQPIAAMLPPSGWGPHGASKSGFSKPLESAPPRPLNPFRSGLSGPLDAHMENKAWAWRSTKDA
jgi:hypothetical protein